MNQINSLIDTYKYLAILPLAVLEGPVLAVVCGFFIAKGELFVFFVYPILILGDIIGDTIFYTLGRLGGEKMLQRFRRYLGIRLDTVDKAKQFFENHRNKTIVLSK